ncbi:hypothetical protein QMK34_30675 [Amycolatopsis sp. H20-H5]|nr:hypothetical protein [Amycolatopsis sp. H20-H5]MEC3979628.1 hypothetical protein [Amycolatopsis sp. H20-H5]
MDLGFGLRHCGVGCGDEVDEVVLLDIERTQLGLELAVQEAGSGFFVGDGGADVAADFGDEVGLEADGSVVSLDGVLDPDDVDMRGGTGAVLFVAAEEVGVFAAPAVDGVLDDHALGDAGSLAVAAEQRTLEVVVVDAPMFSSGGAGVEDVLDVVEQVRADEGFVASLVFLAVVGDVAEVVAVVEHLRQFVDRDLLGRVERGGSGAEAALVQLVG